MMDPYIRCGRASGIEEIFEAADYAAADAACMNITVVCDECSDDQEHHGFGFLLADLAAVYLDEGFFHYFSPVSEFLFDNSGDLRVVTGQNIDLRKCTWALVTEIVLCYIGHECIEIVDVRLVALAAVCLKPAGTDLRNEVADVHDVAQYEIVLAVEIIEKVGV